MNNRSPKIFAVNFITAIAFQLQCEKLLTDEVALLFAGELDLPLNDPIGKEIDDLDRIIANAQCLLLESETQPILA